MQNTAIVNSNQLQLMVQFMQQRQIALSDVFDNEQLALVSAACAGQQISHVPVSQFVLLLEQLADYLKEPTIGLSIAQGINTANLGILGYLLHACENMGEALLRLHRYGKWINNDMEQMQIIQQGHQIELRWPQPKPINGILHEMGMAILQQFSLQLVGRPLNVNHVHFAHSLKGGPEKLKIYEQFFGCPVLFDQPYSAFSFPAHTLHIPIEKPDKALLDILQQQAEQALKSMPSTGIFLQQAQRKLIELCQLGEPTLAQLARQLHLSTRTLQRRLMQHEVSFQQLLDEVRQQLCTQYLHQHVPLSDIAQLLGYSDQSAFTRAYKRWTGSTPFQQRRLKN